MLATDGETGRREEEQKVPYVTYGKNAMSAQLLEVSIRSRNGAPSRNGCVVNGQITKASNK